MSTFTFPRLLPGTVFEQRFRIVRHLGDGGMGTVYEVVHVFMNKPMALKLVPLTAKPKNLDLRDHFALEMQTLAAIDHPSIVKIYDGGVTDGYVAYIAMSLLPGQPLRHLLVHRAMNDLRASLILGDVASGLRVLHAISILHRDIKPENIFITKQGETKLIDFGLARVRTASKYATKNPVPVGTLHYMPFEQLMNIPHDESVDIYAFGLVAWECFAGIHPLATMSGSFRDRQTAMERITSKVPLPHLSTVRRDLPRALGDLIERCTSPDPAERPRADMLIDPFAEFARIAKEERDARAVTNELPPKPAPVIAFVEAVTEPQKEMIAVSNEAVTDPQLEPPAMSDPFDRTEKTVIASSELPQLVAAAYRAWLGVTYFDLEKAKELDAFLEETALPRTHVLALIAHFEATIARQTAHETQDARPATANGQARSTAAQAQHSYATISTSLAREVPPGVLSDYRDFLSLSKMERDQIQPMHDLMAKLPADLRKNLNAHLAPLILALSERERANFEKQATARARAESETPASRAGETAPARSPPAPMDGNAGVARRDRWRKRITFALAGALVGLVLVLVAVIIERMAPGTLPFFARPQQRR